MRGRAATNDKNNMDMKKIVVLTGAGMSAESGLKTCLLYTSDAADD